MMIRSPEFCYHVVFTRSTSSMALFMVNDRAFVATVRHSQHPLSLLRTYDLVAASHPELVYLPVPILVDVLDDLIAL